MKKEFLECGKILTPHGVRGLVKIESWCDSPKVLCAKKRVFFAEKDGSYRAASVISSQPMGELVLMHIDGIEDRETAQALRGTVLYLKREDFDLKEGVYFIADLIGAPCIDAESGEILGEIEDLQDSVAHRIYYVKTPEGKTALIPDIPEFIKSADPTSGIKVKTIPGLFPEVKK